ncbi:MAG: TatD family hydrolase [Calditrichaeota bacterium]|nr:TatD family hydrolase [Calditrichota bacterium]MCB9369183.1 TatD family hydrolase [Calditrichota bacterium]
MIDTHCHLYFEQFSADLEEVLLRAREAGVDRAITIAIDRETGEQCLEIVNRFPGQVFCALGIHPSETDKTTEEDLDWVEAAVGDPAVVAVGEIGLDIYRGETNIKEQEVLFERLLELARRVDLPVVIHHRAAGLRTVEIIESAGNHKGVFHCFSEDYDYAKRVLDAGFMISFTGNITYKNSKLPELAAKLPLDRLMLETDAPFMAPVPHRGRRAEPAHVRDIALKLSETHNISLAEIDRITTETAQRLFFSDGRVRLTSER